ncbi:hypothetical protein KSS87_009945 [Heliosperma pusillum]|nr:hypothetical protein KSS87_009945 [Heliosperma pusillum]
MSQFLVYFRLLLRLSWWGTTMGTIFQCPCRMQHVGLHLAFTLIPP